MDAKISWRCKLMPNNLSNSLQRRFKASEIEHDIRRMEVDLDSNRQQNKLIEEAINERQHQLEQLQPRLRTSITSEDDDD